jgi:DNA-directed RNA polymerase subunit L
LFEDLKVRINYCQVLMNCIVANKLMIEKNPLKKINIVKENHTIKRLIKSNEDVNYMICDCSDDSSKILLLSFGLTKSMEDFLLSYQFCDSGIKGVEDSFHTGLYLRAQNIPIHDIIDKILNENYEIIFTGYSLGACIAALVAIRIITHEKIFNDESKRNKVLFFGFGAPAFCNNQFKQFIEKECKENFHFYIHNRDHTIEIMNCLVDFCLSKKDIKSDNLEFKLGLQLIESVTNFSKENLAFQLLSALNFD